MRPMILDDHAREWLADLRRYAEANPYDRDHNRRVYDGLEPPPGDHPEHVAHVEIGYRIVFSVGELECRPPDTEPFWVWCRHLSVSVPAPDKLPHPAAVAELMPLLGMGDDLEQVKVWIDEASNSINVILLMDEEVVT